ncbi:hypothetical protein DL93DRAFT_2097046 [Clavulina sp. PMI_390]|nr:hypothetical protein DL93DRAFT_2097046 [Clavulina sp. PMI_390]
MPPSPRSERRYSLRAGASPAPYSVPVTGPPAAGGSGAPSDNERGAHRPVGSAPRAARIASRMGAFLPGRATIAKVFASNVWVTVEEWLDGVTGEKEVKGRMRNYNARTLHEDDEHLSFEDMYAQHSWRPTFGPEDSSSNEEASSPSLHMSDVDTTIIPQSPLDMHAMVVPLSATESSASDNDGPHGGYPWSPRTFHATMSEYLHVPGPAVHSDASSPSPIIEAHFFSASAFRHRLPPYSLGFDPIGDGAYPEDKSGRLPFA